MTKINSINVFITGIISINCILTAFANENPIFIIPFKPTDEMVQKIDSFRIDSPSIIKIVSAKLTPEIIIKHLANTDELEEIVEILDEVTVGDVYRATFPHGVLYSLNENILKRLGLSSLTIKKSFRPPISLHKVPFIPLSEVINEPEIASVNDDVFDEVIEDNSTKNVTIKALTTNDAIGKNATNKVLTTKHVKPRNVDSFKETPITDDYINDEPVVDIEMVGDPRGSFGDSNSKNEMFESIAPMEKSIEGRSNVDSKKTVVDWISDLF